MPVYRSAVSSLPASAITGLTANRVPIVNGAGVLTTDSKFSFNGTLVKDGKPTRAASGDVTFVVGTDYAIAQNCNGADRVANLPSLATCAGQTFALIRSDDDAAHKSTPTPNGGDTITIPAGVDIALYNKGQSLTFRAADDASTWYIGV